MIRKGEEKDKLRYNLISFEGITQVAQVATFGAFKHGENDWRVGNDDHGPLKASQALDALLRHLTHLLEGKTLVDIDSGLLITGHIAWNALALCEILTQRPELNDLKEVLCVK